MTLDTILASLAGIGAGGYAVWRKLKSDKNSDAISESALGLSEKIDMKTQHFIENLEKQLENKVIEAKHLTEVIERVANERNEAVQQVGRLEATVSSLDTKVTEMRGEMQQLEQENTRLANQVEEMTQSLKKLGTQIVELAEYNHKLILQLQDRILMKNESPQTTLKE